MSVQVEKLEKNMVKLTIEVPAEELEDIKYEISKSKGGEREWWIRRRRRLWLSILPFVKY